MSLRATGNDTQLALDFDGATPVAPSTNLPVPPPPLRPGERQRCLATSSAPLAERWSLHLGSSLNLASGEIHADTDDFQGAVAAPNLQVLASVEWRVSRVVALVLALRFAPWVDYDAAGEQTFQLDESTEIVVAASGDVAPSGAQFAASAMLFCFVAPIWFPWYLAWPLALVSARPTVRAAVGAAALSALGAALMGLYGVGALPTR